MVIVKAPAVAKLYGEHAVVYGRLSVAVALSAYAYADISEANSGKLEISLPQMNASAVFSRSDLEGIFYDYAFRSDINAFAGKYKKISEHVLPYASIASRLMFHYGISAMGKRVAITSDIPIKKGLASSAACSTAFTVAMLKHAGATLPEGEIIDIARDGDRVLHRSEGAGKIDVSTSFYGGYVSYSSKKGAKREPIERSMNLVLVDTGPKKSTSETVGHVADLYGSQKDETESIFDMIEECSVMGLEAIKKGDMAMAGSLMFKNHELLGRLGVSSDGLDKVVDISKKHDAYGAKLTGGGGGGIAMVLHSNPASIISELSAKGYQAYEYNVSMEGSRSSIEQLLNSSYSR